PEEKPPAVRRGGDPQYVARRCPGSRCFGFLPDWIACTATASVGAAHRFNAWAVPSAYWQHNGPVVRPTAKATKERGAFTEDEPAHQSTGLAHIAHRAPIPIAITF